ncbi:hypothetical protein JCM10212_006517 [Sporobolomyces blumeae]
MTSPLTPSGSASQAGDAPDYEELLKTLKAHQHRTARLQAKKQRVVVRHAEDLATQYERDVERVLDDRDDKLNRRVEEHVRKQAELATRIRELEREALELLRRECSEGQLASASVAASLEHISSVETATMALLTSIQQEEMRIVENGLVGLWPPIVGVDVGLEDEGVQGGQEANGGGAQG